VFIGPGGACTGPIDAARVVIDGTVEGDVIARELLELRAGAVVHGDITALRLIAAEGARIVGQVRIGDDALNARACPRAG